MIRVYDEEIYKHSDNICMSCEYGICGDCKYYNKESDVEDGESD